MSFSPHRELEAAGPSAGWRLAQVEASQNFCSDVEVERRNCVLTLSALRHRVSYV